VTTWIGAVQTGGAGKVWKGKRKKQQGRVSRSGWEEAWVVCTRTGEWMKIEKM